MVSDVMDDKACRPVASPPADDSSVMAMPVRGEGGAMMPLPQDIHAFLLCGILILLLLDALYFAAHVLLPVMFAFLLQLLLQPAMRALGKLRVPKTAAALLVLVAI